MPSVKINKVQHTAPKVAAIRYLDRVCFQGDTPFPIYSDTDLWIGTDNGIPVCFGALTHAYGDTGFLSRAGVLPQYSGNGLHRRLVNLRLRAAKKKGWTSVITYAHRMNTRSINNLIRCGFQAYEPAAEWGHDEALYLWRTL